MSKGLLGDNSELQHRNHASRVAFVFAVILVIQVNVSIKILVPVLVARALPCGKILGHLSFFSTMPTMTTLQLPLAIHTLSNPCFVLNRGSACIISTKSQLIFHFQNIYSRSKVWVPSV